MNKVGVHCRVCTEKYEACHDYCPKYKEAKAKRTEELEIIHQARMKNRPYDTYRADAVNRALRKKKIEGR